MANSPAYPNDDSSAGTDRGFTTAYPGTPRWVKVSGILAIILVLLVVIMMFAGDGSHGPGRHLPSGSADEHTSSLALGVHRP